MNIQKLIHCEYTTVKNPATAGSNGRSLGRFLYFLSDIN